MQVLSHTPLAERRFKDQDRQPVADRILDRILEKKKARKALKSLAVSAAQGGAAAEVAVPAKAVEVVEVSSSAAAVAVPVKAVEVVEVSSSVSPPLNRYFNQFPKFAPPQVVPPPPQLVPPSRITSPLSPPPPRLQFSRLKMLSAAQRLTKGAQAAPQAAPPASPQAAPQAAPQLSMMDAPARHYGFLVDCFFWC